MAASSLERVEGRVEHATDAAALVYDMTALKRAAIAGLGVVALPGYVCREDVRAGSLRRVLPAWHAGDSTITALIPSRRGLLPSVRVFVDHLSAELPKMVLL